MKHTEDEMPIIVTSLDQSREMVNAGVATTSADACYVLETIEGFSCDSDTCRFELKPFKDVQKFFDTIHKQLGYSKIKVECVPCWSMKALDDMLCPNVVVDGIDYELRVNRFRDRGYSICYHNFIHGDIFYTAGNDFIGTAYKAIIWLTAKKLNYIS